MKFLLAALSVAVASAYSPASPSDLARANRKIPGHSFLGSDIATMNQALNTHLVEKYGDVTKPCEEFTASDLQFLQTKIYGAADPTLLKTYEAVDADLPTMGRRRTEDSFAQLKSKWEAVGSHLKDSKLHEVYRDGLCHQTVMWFVHHLSESAREEISKAVQLPLLPLSQHSAPTNPTESADIIHKLYDSHTTCQACHTAGIANQGTMAPPLTPDPAHPGWDRIRRCDAACTGTPEEGCVQYSPPCGACDGVGGPYFGDALADFVPVNCKIVATPDQVPVGDRIKANLPKQFKVELQGTDRLVRVQNPGNSTLYSNIHGQMYIDEARADGYLALRHDTYYDKWPKLDGGHVTEIHIQTPAMGKANLTGAMWSTIAALKPFEDFPNLGYCTCVPAPVGVPHWDAFDDAQYMGRITLDPIEYLNRTVLVDHWAKWFFHVFVDVDKTSPTFGQVMRFYSPYAGFAVYHNWQFKAPESIWPEVWTDSLPKKGPQKCMNVQNVTVLCDSYWPKAEEAIGQTAEQPNANSRHPLFPAAKFL